MIKKKKKTTTKKPQKKPAEIFEEQLFDTFNSKELDFTLQKEYKFHPIRRWRFDFAWVACKIAVEIMGGIWSGGRHITPMGYQKDCEKLNAAQELGWHVYYFTSAMVKSGEAIETIKRVLK